MRQNTLTSSPRIDDLGKIKAGRAIRFVRLFYAGNQRIDVPNGDVKAYFQNGNRIVDVDVPNVVKGNISGKYNLGDLSKMLQNGFDKVLVGTPQKKLYRGQQFTYNFDASNNIGRKTGELAYKPAPPSITEHTTDLLPPERKIN